MLIKFAGTYDESTTYVYQTPLTLLDLVFDLNITVILNKQLQIKSDTENVYQPSFDLISIKKGEYPDWIPSIQQKRYALDEIHLEVDITITIPELGAVRSITEIDHMWHFTPLVKKLLLPVLEVLQKNGLPHDLDVGVDPNCGHTLESTYESATAKLSYRLLPHIDLDELRLACLGDDIWCCQRLSKLGPRATSSHEGDIVMMEISAALLATMKIHKLEIIDIFSESLRARGSTHETINRQIKALRDPGWLLADPTTGMAVKT